MASESTQPAPEPAPASGPASDGDSRHFPVYELAWGGRRSPIELCLSIEVAKEEAERVLARLRRNLVDAPSDDDDENDYDYEPLFDQITWTSDPPADWNKPWDPPLLHAPASQSSRLEIWERRVLR